MTTADEPSPPSRPQPSSHHLRQQFATANIYRCLAPCKECTGNYISEILQKRFICYCRCHKITKNIIDSAISHQEEHLNIPLLN
jgi:hypothetical protein